MHAHEIVLRSKGGDPNDPRNVVCICNSCHLLGLHRQTSDRTQWFVIVILNVEHGAEDPNGIAFAPFETKAERWAREISD
jgi:hypothetical protein